MSYEVVVTCAAIDTVARLAAMGAGGAVCHTAGVRSRRRRVVPVPAPGCTRTSPRRHVCATAIGTETRELAAGMQGGSAATLPPSVAGSRYRITNGFPIGSLDRFIQIVFGRV